MKTVWIPFLTAEIIYTAIWLAVRIIIWAVHKHIDWKREAVLLLMYINIAVIIRFTFFPMDLLDGNVQPLVFEPSLMLPFRINLIPLRNLFCYTTTRKLLLNVVGNAAMFIPSGMILPYIYKRLDIFFKVLLAGAGMSLCIEILQLPFAGRASDIDDLILNTCGVIIGYIIYAVIRKIKKHGAGT